MSDNKAFSENAMTSRHVDGWVFDTFCWVYFAAAVFIFDQWTKNLAWEHLAGGDVRLTGPWALRLTVNAGMSLGFGDTAGAAVTFACLMLMGATAAVISVLPKRTDMALGLSMMLGGGMGNAADRIVSGGVTDFLSFDTGDGWTLVFNAADVWIAVGATLVAVSWLYLLGESE